MIRVKVLESNSPRAEVGCGVVKLKIVVRCSCNITKKTYNDKETERNTNCLVQL